MSLHADQRLRVIRDTWFCYVVLCDSDMSNVSFLYISTKYCLPKPIKLMNTHFIEIIMYLSNAKRDPLPSNTFSDNLSCA